MLGEVCLWRWQLNWGCGEGGKGACHELTRGEAPWAEGPASAMSLGRVSK